MTSGIPVVNLNHSPDTERGFTMNKLRLVSVSAHLLIAALILLLGTVAHTVVQQQHAETLVFPMDLPVPLVHPIQTLRAPSVTRLSIGVVKLSPGSHDVAPQVVKLEASSIVELPQITQSIVTEAPQVTVGSFGQPTGVIGSGNGHGVSLAGFGANARPQGMHAGGRIVAAGFNITQAPAAVPVAVGESIQPPVVSYEASPIYTETAHEAHISGVVVLRVRFTAEGSVKVLRVVQGLGYGLDESAIRTAESIRFTPAVQGGHAVAFDTLARITFQLGVE
jgi:TonB family protein